MRHIKKTLFWAGGVIVLVLALALSAPVLAADLEVGLEAYERGDYATALNELRPLAGHNIAPTPAQALMRWIVGGHAVTKQVVSTSQMGRFETEVLATDENLAALANLSGRWIDRVHDRRPPKMIILDMDSSVSPNTILPDNMNQVFAPFSDPDHLNLRYLRQIERHAAPARADVKHPLAGPQRQLGGDVAQLVPLRFFQRFAGFQEIGAGIVEGVV
jgi:hypothetical protein